MSELAAHLERAKELRLKFAAALYLRDAGTGPDDAKILDALEPIVAAALAACAREASQKLKPYCRHQNSCAAFPARSEQQIKRDCDCGLIAAERAVGEKGRA